MSRFPLGPLATVAVAILSGLPAAGASAASARTDDRWQATAPLPERTDGPLLALAVDPGDASQVLAGTARGSIYRSADGGASWRPVRSGLRAGVVALAFSPQHPRTVLAGTRGAGVLRSVDGGVTWQDQPGTESRTVRAFAFARELTFAGSDQGVLVDRGSGAWAAIGPAQVRVGALVALAADDSDLLAGGTSSPGPEPLPLYATSDGGQSWAPVSGSRGGDPGFAGSSLVAALAAGPARSDAPPVLMGTNAGLFLSPDRGETWQQVTGGGALPATDFSAAAFGGRPDRFYVASDGGGSDRGGLWATTDGGGHFVSLAPPLSSVTALAVSGDEAPVLYAATFRPVDHAVAVWSYRDTGAGPQAPAASPPPAASGRAPAAGGRAGSTTGMAALVAGPEGPYLLVGLAALLVVLVALAAHLRRGRQL